MSAWTTWSDQGWHVLYIFTPRPYWYGRRYLDAAADYAVTHMLAIQDGADVPKAVAITTLAPKAESGQRSTDGTQTISCISVEEGEAINARRWRLPEADHGGAAYWLDS